MGNEGRSKRQIPCREFLAPCCLTILLDFRTGKAFLQMSVECRAPFQASAIADFLVAAPAPLRFSDATITNYLLRRLVARHLGEEFIDRSMYGFKAPLWGNPTVRRRSSFEDEIQAMVKFDELPFRSIARLTIIDPRMHKSRWPFYASSQTCRAFVELRKSTTSAEGSSSISISRPNAAWHPRSEEESR